MHRIKRAQIILNSSRNFSLKKAYPFYLNNEPVFANQDLIVKNKYTLENATVVAQAKAHHIEEAIQGALRAKDEMAELGSYERKAILNQVVTATKERFEEFAQVLCIEAGKPIKYSFDHFK
jgi:acyl-CoA reductase-like NAD-dependent aldehyde dehydrogenase